MAVAQGYGKTSSNGLIFAYDAADMVNSFKGKPGTNILVGPIKDFSGYSITNYSNGKLFETNGYTEVVNIPTLGFTTVESVEINNVYSGYGTDGNYNCCPTLFQYSNSWRSTQLQGNTNYTYQIVYKCDSGYTNPNYMYHYEYRADGTYNTEFGVHDNSRRTELGDGWYHAWGSFTTQPTTADGYFGCWYYNYNTKDKLSIAKISLQQGLSILPPKQLITPNTTRSMTEGLYDLVGNTTLNLSNVSFNTEGMLVFDGTGNYVDVATNFGVVSEYTIEHVSYKGSESRMPIAGRTNTAFYQYGDNSWAYTHGGVWGEYYYPKTVTINGWGHWTIVYNGSYVKIYRNGVFEGEQATSGTANFSDGFKIGYWSGGGGYAWNGQIAVVKIYNRALSSSEISKNYNHYKTRYNLS
jgi:hypothetical protein